MAQPFKYRDLVTSYLREDTRIMASVLASRRVFEHTDYDIYLCIYSGLMDNSRLHSDLVTALVVFKLEAIRVMVKLWTDEIGGDRSVYIEQAVKRLETEGKGPLHLIRDAKAWCHLRWTEKDRQLFDAHKISQLSR